MSIGSENRNFNTFVLGVGSPIGLSILRDLGQNGFNTIGIGGENSIGHASKYCNLVVIRESSPEKVIAQLIELGGNPSNNFLLSVSEGDIKLINQNREALSAYFSILVPEQAQMDVVLDKSKTKLIADTLNINSPKSFQLTQLKELVSYADELSFPVVLKWANPLLVQNILYKSGIEYHKLQYANNHQELERFLSIYEKINAFPLIQEYCEGKGLGQFFLCKDGISHLEFQHERLHEWPPEGGTSTYCISIPINEHQECMNKSKALLKKLNWTGVAMVEYRYSKEQQKYVLMEINGRFWGSSPLAIYAGTGFASNMVKLLGLNQKIEQPTLRHYKCLYMIPELKRLYRILFEGQKIQDPNIQFSKTEEIITLLKAILTFGSKYFVFNFDDPSPFFKDMKNVLKKIMKR